MYEVLHIRQNPGEARRRWFSSHDFDLIVWYQDDVHISGFELSYDKQHGEHAIVWHQKSGFRHMVVDDGEQAPGKYKATPILQHNGHFDASRISHAVRQESNALPPEIGGLLLQKLSEYPDSASLASANHE